MPAPPAREHSVETIRRNSEVMGNLRKLMVANRGVSFAYQLFLFYVFFSLTMLLTLVGNLTSCIPYSS